MDTQRFVNQRQASRVATPEMVERQKKIIALSKEKGWVPSPTLAGRDDPNHKETPGLFDPGFAPTVIQPPDWLIEGVTPLF